MLVATCGLYKTQCSSCDFTICSENLQIMKIHDLHDSDRGYRCHAEETAALEVLIMLNQFFNSYETTASAAWS